LQVTIAILRHKRGAFGCPHAISYAYDISNMLIIVSSSTNFIIYFLLRPHFRATLRDRVTCVDPAHRHDNDMSLQSAVGPWHVDVATGLADHKNAAKHRLTDGPNNHIDKAPAPLRAHTPAAVEGPLLAAKPRNRTSTM